MSKFKVGQTVQRVESSYTHAPIFIKNEFTLKYVNDLADLGYEYQVVKEVEDAMDFELPTVKQKPSTAPRVHMGGDVCVACEG